jgi:hypothetical protein
MMIVIMLTFIMLSVDMLCVIMLHVDKLLILAVLSISKETVIMGSVIIPTVEAPYG